MIALVTGATGFIGRHLCNSLIADGDVVALEHNASRFKTGERLTVVRGDVRDLAFMRQVMSRYEVDTVFHLAAQTQVSIGHADPTATYDMNVRGTWTMLEACRLEGVRRVVVASSDKAYGECKDIKEDAAYLDGPTVNPQCHYSVSKAMADMTAQSFSRNHGMSVSITRCGNVYGPGDTHWRRLVPGAVRAALRKEPYILRTDGSGVRDYLYVDDAVNAYRLLAKSEHVGPFNFSGGEPLSATRVIDKIWNRLGNGPELRVQYGTDRAELKVQTLCCDKAAKLLGWRPSVKMADGLDKTIVWAACV
jgi:CDP-glucose 4,6-dehydratase